MKNDTLLAKIEAELGPRFITRAVVGACILTRLAEKFPDRKPTEDEVFAEADAWLAEVKAAKP